MKKLFTVQLKCPFCGNEFDYNIMSFKAKHECSKCNYDLIVRTKPVVSAVISLIGFFLLLALRDYLGIAEMSTFINLIYIGIGCMLYISVAYKCLCKIKSATFLYQVDMQDPTVLLRVKQNRK